MKLIAFIYILALWSLGIQAENPRGTTLLEEAEKMMAQQASKDAVHQTASKKMMHDTLHDTPLTRDLFAAILKNDANKILDLLHPLATQRPNINSQGISTDTFRKQKDEDAVRALTPLMVALYLEHSQIAHILLKQPDLDGKLTDSRNRSALHYAVESGDQEAVKMLMQLPAGRRPDINLQDIDGNTASMLGKQFKSGILSTPKKEWSEKDQQQVVEKSQNDSLALYTDKATADLFKAVRDKSSQAAINLITNHLANINSQAVSSSFFSNQIKTATGLTPLMGALALKADAIVVSLLAQTTLDGKLRDSNGRTALHYAVQYGNQEAVKQLMLLPPERRPSLKARDNEGKTASMLSPDYQKTVEHELRRQNNALYAKVNASTVIKEKYEKDQEALTQQTKDLVKAIESRNVSKVKELLALTPEKGRPHINTQGVKLSIRDYDYDNKKQIEDILKQEQSLYIYNWGREWSWYIHGITPLMLAMKKEHDTHGDSKRAAQAIVQLILEQPDLDASLQDSFGRTALHDAVLNNNHAEVAALLNLPKEHRPDINLRDHAGKTAAMYQKN